MAESGPLRGGVIGAGVFGGYHAKQYARLPGVVLSGVLDVHPDRAAQTAMPLGGRGFTDMAQFLDAVDVVTVASPATFHAQHALADDIALDLVGAAADRGELGVQGQEVGVLGARMVGAFEQAAGAQDGGAQARLLVQDARHGELAEAHDRRGCALGEVRLGAGGVERV